MKTTVLLDHHTVPEGHLVRMLLRIEGSPPPAGTRTPLELGLVLDRSGSMHGGKLAAARKAATEVVRRLWPQDRVSVVAYDDEVETVVERAAGGDAPDLARQIAAIDSRGTTNLSGGWLRARELLAGRDGDEHRVRRIVLLTDGLANVGITDPDRLASLAAKGRKAGVTTTTIGFGADYDERLLRRMAEAGGGGTYYIERPDQALAIFQDELSDLLDTCAQNLAVTLAPAGATQAVRVRHAYTSTSTPAGVRYDMGDLYAREPRQLLVEFLLPSVPGDTVPVATLTVTADVLDGDDVRHETVTLPVTLDAAHVPHVDPAIAREALLLDAADAREEALRAREEGDFRGAHATLGKVLTSLRSAGLDDEQVQAEIADLDAMAAAPPETLAEAANAKYLYQRAYDRKSGRARKLELIERMKRAERRSGGEPKPM